MVDIAELGIRARSDLSAAKSEMSSLTKEAQLTENAVEDLSQATDRLSAGGVKTAKTMKATTTAMRGNSQGFRNLGLQLNQVAQQGAVTGNYMQALSIQLPDLLLGFGTLGIALGVVAGAFGPFILGLLDSADSAEVLEETMEGLGKSTKALMSLIDETKKPLSELSDIYGNAAFAVRDLLSAQVELAQYDLAKQMRSAVQGITEDFGDLSAVSAQAFDQIANKGEFIKSTMEQLRQAQASGDTERLAALQEEIIALGQLPDVVARVAGEYETTTGQAQELLVAVREFQQAGDFTAQANAARTLAQEINEAAGGVQNMDDRTRALYDSLLAAGIEAAKVADIDMSSNIGDAANEAARLANNLNAAARLSAATNGGPDGARFGLMDEGRIGGHIDGIVSTVETGPNSRRKGRKRGGSGGADGFEGRLEALKKGLMSEREVVDAWYSESQEILADRRAQEILGEEEHRKVLLEVEKSYQEQLAAIQMSKRDEQLGEVSGFFGAMASVTAQGGDKLVKATQTFGAIEALINTYRAQAQVLADPTLGWFGKLAAYASIGAAGLGVVNAIKGGGGGGGAASASTAAAAQAQAPQRVILEGIDRNSLISGDMLSNLLDGLNEEAGDRGFKLMVAR